MVDVFFASIVLAAATAVQPFAVEAVNRRIASADASVALSRFVGYPAGAKSDKFTPNPKIQQAMDGLCPGYTLEEFDFSTIQPPAPKN